MDTTPFHLLLFALDIFIWGGLFLWIRHRRNNESPRSAAYHFEKSLYVPGTVVRPPSLVWDITGTVLFGGFGFFAFAFLSRLIFTDYVQKKVYYFNVGQCIAEGIAVHGTLFFIVTALLLFWNRRNLFAVFYAVCAVVFLTAGFDVLYWEPYHLWVEHYKIKTAKVKKPIRIVFVADIQTDRIGFHERRTLQKIQQQKADLIILGGDYVQTFVGTRDKNLSANFRQLFLDIPLEAPLGVYAIPGNIVGAGDAELFKGTTVEWIQDSTVFDNLGADQGLGPLDVVLLGLGDSCGGLGERGLTDSGNFIIMAGHYPNYAVDGYTGSSGRHLTGYRETERAPDLMLAGHTHGCQIVIPGYGPIPFGGDKYVQQTPRNMRLGFHTYPNGGHLLVTRGSGMERGWAPRIRLFCPAEISVIDIVPE